MNCTNRNEPRFNRQACGLSQTNWFFHAVQGCNSLPCMIYQHTDLYMRYENFQLY